MSSAAKPAANTIKNRNYTKDKDNKVKKKIVKKKFNQNFNKHLVLAFINRVRVQPNADVQRLVRKYRQNREIVSAPVSSCESKSAVESDFDFDSESDSDSDSGD